MKLNLGAGPKPLDGFDNLCPQVGWHFEDGLGQYEDGSVEGITCSHATMYLPLEDWPAFLAEVFRVLQPGGILRVTEDNTEDPESERFGGYTDAVTLTGPRMMRAQLKAAGFRVREYAADRTGFHDGSLLQAWHGPAPKCFWMEGRKA